jgi:hypothetical protein
MPYTDHRRQKGPTAGAVDSPVRSRGRVAPNTTSRAKRTSAARMPPGQPVQHGLFLEFVEITTTRDERFAEGTRPVPPSGKGWRIADYGDEHATTWARTRLIPSWGRSP